MTPKLTNGREIAVYAIAQIVKIALVAVLAGPVVAPLMRSIAGSSNYALAFLVGAGFSLGWAVLALVLFLILRGLVGGTPETITGPGRERAIATSGAEIGAYAIGWVLQYMITLAYTYFAARWVYEQMAGSDKVIFDIISYGPPSVFAAIGLVFFLVVRKAIMGGAASLLLPSLAEDAVERPSGSLGFGDSIAIGFSKYANFRGRARRSEFWWWALFNFLIQVVLNIFDAVVLPGSIIGLSMIAGLGLFIPNLAVSVRRLHDIDKSGWWLLICFIPLAGAIVLLVFDCLRGTPGPNRFGPRTA